MGFHMKVFFRSLVKFGNMAYPPLANHNNSLYKAFIFQLISGDSERNEEKKELSHTEVVIRY